MAEKGENRLNKKAGHKMREKGLAAHNTTQHHSGGVNVHVYGNSSSSVC